MVSVTALAVPLGAEQQLQSHSQRAKIPSCRITGTLGSTNPPTGASSTPLSAPPPHKSSEGRAGPGLSYLRVSLVTKFLGAPGHSQRHPRGPDVDFKA